MRGNRNVFVNWLGVTDAGVEFTDDGGPGVRLRDTASKRQMKGARKVMAQNRDTLRELAKR